MQKLFRSRARTLAALFVITCASAVIAQTTARHSCHRLDFTPSPADDAFHDHDYAKAETLYIAANNANPSSSEAMAGVVRSLLANGKPEEALNRATHFDAAHPNDPVLIDALGAVHFRLGEVADAANDFNRATQLDPCNPQTHFDEYVYFNFAGLHATAQQQLDMAHSLMPDNPLYANPWRNTHQAPPTQAQVLEGLRKRLDDPSLTAEQKANLATTIKAIETRGKGNCELAAPVSQTKMQLASIETQSMDMLDEAIAVGLDVQLNGKKKRLEVDTGASGLIISRAAALADGLVPELETRLAGFGDGSPTHAFVTHVDDIRIGNMDFKNCIVQVVEDNSGNRRLPQHVDGLIGTDVFRDYLVTLDVPGLQLRLDPLPPRPTDHGSAAVSLDTDNNDGDQTLSAADRARDRYIAPEMKGWTPIYRTGHELFVPASVANAPIKLMLVDSGSSGNMISPALGRQVSIVSEIYDRRMEGMSGEVSKVRKATDIAITFANVRQMTHIMPAVDLSAISRDAGVEISGVIGFPMIRELVTTIDYRDNLMHIVYDAKKGYHGPLVR